MDGCISVSREKKKYVENARNAGAEHDSSISKAAQPRQTAASMRRKRRQGKAVSKAPMPCPTPAGADSGATRIRTTGVMAALGNPQRPEHRRLGRRFDPHSRDPGGGSRIQPEQRSRHPGPQFYVPPFAVGGL